MRKVILDEILAREWEMFQQVNNIGGLASCQDDQKTFDITRASQFDTYPDKILESYLNDLQQAEKSGRNLVMEKYARMMATTHPIEYEKFQDVLPEIDSETATQIERIIDVHLNWQKNVAERYPSINDFARPLTSDQDSPAVTSIETYLRGELQTYSANTIAAYGQHLEECIKEGKNLAKETLLNMMKGNGFQSLEEAEVAAQKSIGKVR